MLQTLAARWSGGAPLDPALRWAVGVISTYGAGLPLAAWCMKRVPAVPGSRSRPALRRGELAEYAAALLGLMDGANLMTLAVQAALGGTGGGETGLSTYPAALVVIQTVILAPLAEETLFRGLMLRRLLPFGERPAVALSALCFALAHGSVDQVLYALAGGAVLGYAAVRTGRLWPCVLLHALANAAALVLGQLGSGAELAVVLALLLLGCAAAVHLWRSHPLAASGGWPADFWRQGGMPLALLYALARMALG